MIEGILSSIPEVEKEPFKENLLSAECYTLKAKWLFRIATDRQQISHLMQKILVIESCFISTRSSLSDVSSITVLDRLQSPHKNLSHVMSNLRLLQASSAVTSTEEKTSSHVKKDPFIHYLKTEGYLSVAETWGGASEYPWKEIRKIHNPILIEQLTHIHLLCKYKSKQFCYPEADSQKLMDFVIHLTHFATSSTFNHYSHAYELVNDTKQLLGQLIYLINKNPRLAVNAIDVSLYKNALENIKNSYHLYIQRICHRLQNYYIAHQQTQLQDPAIALYTQIPREIAKTLLTEIGTINIGIIDSLCHIFLSHEKQPINHEVNLIYSLKMLEHSPKLRAEFEKISHPRSDNIASNDVIRASIGLFPDHQVDHLDTRLAALIALLSHLRQGSDRSCFAISLVIEMLSAHLGWCFKDLRQLLETGKLTRQIKSIRKEIPFINRMSDQNLQKQITFNAEGSVIFQGVPQAHLWKAPGLQAVCQSLNLKNPEAVLSTIFSQLPLLKSSEFHTLEIRTLIKKLCEQVKFSEETSLENLYHRACFAFSSHTAQPLLKVWENAIANMAEVEKGSMIKTAILESTLDALQFKLGEQSIPPSLHLQRFFLHIQKILYERMQLQYDPTVFSYLQGESSVEEGGFVLYDQEKRIDHEKDFRQFIYVILVNASQKMLKGTVAESTKNTLNHVLKILTSYLESPEFIGYLLARYHPSNKLAVSRLSKGESISYQHLYFTPWITRTGNNSKALMEIYFELTTPIPSEYFVSSEANKTLAHIIDMCKQMSPAEKQLYVKNPHKLKPLCILGKHRLPFMAGHPSLASAWQKNYPTQEWIDYFVIKPGTEIADTLIDSQTQQNILLLLQQEVLPSVMSQIKIKGCIELIQRIPKNLTIQHYRNYILHICQSIHSLSKPSLAKKFVRQIDTMLCRSLEPSCRKKLQDSAIHFADTNWYHGVQDIHFCFAVNPGTRELELWEVYANGSHLMALDQNYWLFNQKWEFLMIKDLVPDDSSYL